MRRTLAAGVAVLAAAFAIPGSATGYVLSEDLIALLETAPVSRGVAVGEGKLAEGQPSDQFRIAAHGTPSDARGSVRFNTDGFAEVRGNVTCVFVFGAVAGVSGTLERPIGDFGYFAIAVADNGEPGGSTPDAALYELRDVPAWGGDCGLVALLSLGAPPILQGNVVLKNK